MALSTKEKIQYGAVKIPLGEIWFHHSHVTSTGMRRAQSAARGSRHIRNFSSTFSYTWLGLSIWRQTFLGQGLQVNFERPEIPGYEKETSQTRALLFPWVISATSKEERHNEDKRKGIGGSSARWITDVNGKTTD